MFASNDLGVLESVLLHKLEEYPVVHPSECTLEVRVGRVYVFFFEISASSYIMICVERLSNMFLCVRNPYAVSLKTPSDFVFRVPMFVRMDVKYAVH